MAWKKVITMCIILVLAMNIPVVNGKIKWMNFGQ